MSSELFKFLSNVTKTKSRATALFSLVISTSITTIIYFITAIASGAISNKSMDFFLNGVGTWGAVALVCVYIFLFVSIWTVTYILEQNDAEDLYTWVRKLMLGTWDVRYPVRRSSADEDLAEHDPRATCYIYINDYTKKLEMRFALNNDRIWADRSQIIGLISMKNIVQNEYAMTYYFKGTRKLTDQAACHISPEITGKDPSLVEVEIMGCLEFKASRGTQIESMNGHWFDLNGNVTRVYLLVQESDVSPKPYKKKLSEIEIPGEFAFCPRGKIFFDWTSPLPKNISTGDEINGD
ncbi:hypothetical protein FV219_00530 [Methylobacterium sp. WL122]|nr:hypothetical protein FV219_00530 [Methylobacterium sp. WL122]